MFTPMHEHIDFGFGMTGNAFKNAADKLDADRSERGAILGEHLPIHYLRRHAVELFLKSAIVIIHRKLDLPYGEKPSSSEPFAQCEGEWKSFKSIHSVKRLWLYFCLLCKEHREYFHSIGNGAFDFEPEVDRWISIIEKYDPISTYFRYPNPKNQKSDSLKSAMSAVQPDENGNFSMQLTPKDQKKSFVLIEDNEHGEVSKACYFPGEPLSEFSVALEKSADLFYGLHAAMRALLCGGA